MIRLTEEQLEAVSNHPQGVECAGKDDKLFVIIDAAILRKMQQLLREKENHDAIAEGLRQMEAGMGMSVDEAQRQARAACGFPQASVPDQQDS